MNQTTEAFVTSLSGVRGWGRQAEQVREWASVGRTDILGDIAEVISGPLCPEGVSGLVRKAMLESILWDLALTRSIPAAEAALSLSPLGDRLAAPYDIPHLNKRLASRLAWGQSHETLEPLFARHGSNPLYRELLACLVQETLLRSGAVPAAAADFFARHVVDSGHPLGRLPLRRLPQERMLPQYLPRYGPDSKSWPTPLMGDEPASRPFESRAADDARWTPLELSEQERISISAAVRNWEEESNGVIEAALFRADTEVSSGILAAQSVLYLPLECLLRASIGDIDITAVYPAEALSCLFSAAAAGGAYNSGLDAAYGRLAAWCSAAALVGVDEDASLDEVAAATERCVWMDFTARTEWFYRVAWDLGLLVLRPDRRTLAVLAATDTD